MTVHIIRETDIPLKFHYKDLAKKVVDTVLDLQNFPYEAEVTLTLVDNDMIHEINRETRQIDRPTDVLSFPMIDYDAPADYSLLEASAEIYANPETDEVILGDIVLSLNKVYSQAEEYGHSVKREYAFLITHSMLHLVGYDHMTDEDAALMEAKQREVLDALNILR